MKKYLLILVAVYLSACGSAPVEKTDDFVEDVPGAKTNAEVIEAKPILAKDEVAEMLKEEKVEVSKYQALNQAIKSQNDEAIQKACSEILTQNSKDIRALNALAMVYYKKARFEAAQYLLNKAIAVDSKSSDLHGNLGLVQLAKNDRRDAIKSFRKALELNSQDALAGANLGAVYVQEKDFNKAILALEIPVKKGMKDQKILNNYAISLAATGKAKEASEIYQNILKENPGHKEVMLNYSILLIEEMQKYKEGLDLLNRLKFVGTASESRQIIKDLEVKAKAGLQ